MKVEVKDDEADDEWVDAKVRPNVRGKCWSDWALLVCHTYTLLTSGCIN